MWTIKKIEDIGFKLVVNEKQWCHFRGHGFDVLINLNKHECNGNLFNFHSYKSSFKGNFKAKIETVDEFNTLLKLIV